MPKTAKQGEALRSACPCPACSPHAEIDGWTDRGLQWHYNGTAPPWDGTVMPTGLAAHGPGSTSTLLQGRCTASPAP